MRKAQQWRSSVVAVLIVEASRMNCQLVESAFRPKRRRVKVVASAVRGTEVPALLKETQPDVAVISSQLQEGALEGYRVLREMRSAQVRTRAIMLLHSREPDLVIDAFRCGARGVVFRDEPIETLGKCIHAVYHGQVWANSEHMRSLMEALGETIPIRFRATRGIGRLSKRESEVAQLVAEGFTNKDISLQLGLSEHTVRNYLLHVFDLVLARGWTPRRVALVCYSITAMLGAIALLGFRHDPGRFVALAAASLGLLLAFALRLGSLRTEGKKDAHGRQIEA
ncbi:MAG TPA: response regulator transcription factor [Candidatus Acidoferrum sp.]|nr:response regulator transcription factor [Candidatus Acidoferrum sp.]